MFRELPSFHTHDSSQENFRDLAYFIRLCDVICKAQHNDEIFGNDV